MRTLLVFLALSICCAPINKTALCQAPLKSAESSLAQAEKKFFKSQENTEYPIDESIYLSALNKIEKKYQIRSQKTEERYEIYPVGMYPFFCLSKEDRLIACPPKIKTTFLRSSLVSVREYTEEKTINLQVAVLHCTKGRIPWARIYTLHFLSLDSNNIWQEKGSLSVTTILASREGSLYAPQIK